MVVREREESLMAGDRQTPHNRAAKHFACLTPSFDALNVSENAVL